MPLLCPLQNFGLVDDYHGAQLERAEPTHSHRLVLLGESMQDSVRCVDGTTGIMFFSGVRCSLLTLTPTVDGGHQAVSWSTIRVLLAQDLHRCYEYCSGARLCTTATMVASSGSHARHYLVQKFPVVGQQALVGRLLVVPATRTGQATGSKTR